MNILAIKRRKIKLLKNKQARLLPFFGGERFLAPKYFPHNILTKRLLDERKAKRKAKRKKILNISAFALNLVILAVILIVQLSGDSSTVISPTIDWKFIAVIMGIVLLIVLLDSSKIFILLFASTKKARPFLSYKTSALGKYYDNITPMSTGGQPFQIFYMNKRGVRGDIATGIPLMKYITWQIAYVLICSFALIYNSVKYGGTADPFITTMAWIATAINVIIFSTVILLSVSKKFGPKIVIWVLKLLSKMHIVKNYRKTFRKVMRFVVNYQKTFKTLLKKPLVLIAQLVLSFGDIILLNLIPYFIARAFVPWEVIQAQNITVFRTFIQSLILTLSLGFVPTPGTSGAAEGVFMLVFSGVFSESGLFWPVITWRIATYYYPLLQGLLVLVYDFVIGDKKAERLKKAGAEIYAVETENRESFRESLDKNLHTIEVVQAQEKDKLPFQAFTGINMDSYSGEELIQNSDIVSKEEMNEKVKPVEDIMNEMNEKAKQKHEERMQKRMLKKQKRRFKKNK